MESTYCSYVVARIVLRERAKYEKRVSSRMWRPTTAEVRADEGKATDYSAPAHSTVDRLLCTRRAFTVVQDARRGDHGLVKSGECRMELTWAAWASVSG